MVQTRARTVPPSPRADVPATVCRMAGKAGEGGEAAVRAAPMLQVTLVDARGWSAEKCRAACHPRDSRPMQENVLARRGATLSIGAMVTDDADERVRRGLLPPTA